MPRNTFRYLAMFETSAITHTYRVIPHSICYSVFAMSAGLGDLLRLSMSFYAHVSTVITHYCHLVFLVLRALLILPSIVQSSPDLTN